MDQEAHEGQEVGTVEDLILDQQGQVVGLVISRDAGATERGVGAGGAGGLMGEHGDKVALSWDVIEVQRDPENPEAFILVSDVAPGAVREAPEFDREPEYNGMFN